MELISKAGVVIVKEGKTEPEVLLVFRAKHNDWTFPKGHCEAGESAEETAVREAQEETGLSVELVRPLPDMEYTDSQHKQCVLSMYLAKPVDERQLLKPEYAGDMLAWIPLSAVEEKLSYRNLKEYFGLIRMSLQL